ncbi:NAD(P)H-dependent glycerol-3-phosphate dehydrogenase [bacterium]|nr:NAD(P)H-dependent glycerol-3-phosphate dehydrogenase [bacterium]
MARFTVLGAGSWGTALGILLAEQEEHQVIMWEFLPDVARQLAAERVNRDFLPDTPFPDALKVTNDLDEALHGAEAVLIVVPSQFVRSVLKRIDTSRIDHPIWINCAKGIETETLQRMSEVVEETLGEDARSRYVVLSGPSHAEEVAKKLPTTVVAASERIDLARRVQNWMSSLYFRVYAAPDVIGVELGGSLKNVIAIGTGICDGLGYGDNTRGALITRGLVEIARAGTALGGRPETFSGLSGMGDLITTCTSRHSRNRYVGEQLGKGRTLDDILQSMHMVAEGVKTTKSAWKLAQSIGVEMPITEQVYNIIFEDKSAREAVQSLMMRSLKVEHS